MWQSEIDARFFDQVYTDFTVREERATEVIESALHELMS